MARPSSSAPHAPSARRQAADGGGETGEEMIGHFLGDAVRQPRPQLRNRAADIRPNSGTIGGERKFARRRHRHERFLSHRIGRTRRLRRRPNIGPWSRRLVGRWGRLDTPGNAKRDSPRRLRRQGVTSRPRQSSTEPRSPPPPKASQTTINWAMPGAAVARKFGAPTAIRQTTVRQ